MNLMPRISAKIILEARKDPAVFFSTVMRDGEGFQIAPTEAQRDWLRQTTAKQFATIWAHIQSGMTTFAIARMLWEIALNRNGPIVYVAPTASLGASVTDAMRFYISESREFGEIFPELRADGIEEVHRCDFRIRGAEHRGPSFFTVAPGEGLIPSRIHMLVLDGLVDRRNSETKAQRKKLIEWYETTLLNRLRTTSKQITIGQSHYSDDLMSFLEPKPSQTHVFFGKYTIDAYPQPSPLWSPERIARLRIELGKSAAALLDLVPVVVKPDAEASPLADIAAKQADVDVKASPASDQVRIEKREGICRLTLRIDDAPGETVKRTEKMLAVLQNELVANHHELVSADLTIDKTRGRELVLSALIAEK